MNLVKQDPGNSPAWRNLGSRRYKILKGRNIDVQSCGSSMEDEKYLRAKQRVEELKGFYSHLGIFVLINGFLFIVNLVTSPGNWWFYWVTLFWGIALVYHGARIASSRKVFSREWEERKVRQYMEEEK